MATTTYSAGTRTSHLTLGTLASATYIMGSAIDLSATIPYDLTIELEANPGTTTGNKQLVLFAKFSIDGTNYGTGPESGTTATEEADLHFIGAMPMADTNVHRKLFNINGLPIARYMKLVVKNDSGAALESGTVYTSVINLVSA